MIQTATNAYTGKQDIHIFGKGASWLQDALDFFLY